MLRSTRQQKNRACTDVDIVVITALDPASVHAKCPPVHKSTTRDDGTWPSPVSLMVSVDVKHHVYFDGASSVDMEGGRETKKTAGGSRGD